MEEFDIVKVNDYLRLANYPYYDQDNFASFTIFMNGFEYEGNPDINIKTAYVYSIFLNMIANNATGYPSQILHKLAYPDFTTRGGQSV